MHALACASGLYWPCRLDSAKGGADFSQQESVVTGSLLDAVLVELLSQSVPVQAELARSGGALTVLVSDRRVQQRRFDEVEELLIQVFAIAVLAQTGFGPLTDELGQRDGRRRRHWLAGGRSRGREMFRLDHAAASDDDRVFDRVAQFADVAVPGSASEFGLRGGGQRGTRQLVL